MTQTIDHKLRIGFRDLFPEYAKALDGATSQEEIDTLQAQFLTECQQELTTALGEAQAEEIQAHAQVPQDKTAPTLLKPEQYDALIHARGNAIKNQLHVMIDGLQRLKGMEKEEPGLVTAQMMLAGVLGLGTISANTAIGNLARGAVEYAAALAGVRVATVRLVVAISALVIVAVLIPILYFINKPATCIVYLINELDKRLTFKDDFNVHGKPHLMTSPIERGVGKYFVGGLIAAKKDDSALRGCQYGFTMTYGDLDLSYGVENPLTSTLVDNNCHCNIGESAEAVARATNEHNKQYWEASKGKIKTSIRCNSGSGSIAYYVARAYFA